MPSTFLFHLSSGMDILSLFSIICITPEDSNQPPQANFSYTFMLQFAFMSPAQHHRRAENQTDPEQCQRAPRAWLVSRFGESHHNLFLKLGFLSCTPDINRPCLYLPFMCSYLYAVILGYVFLSRCTQLHKI